MAVNVINGNESRPAPDIIHPLLNSKAAQVGRGRTFLKEESGDHLIATITTQAIPDIVLNKVYKVSGDGDTWLGGSRSVSLSGDRNGSRATISLSRVIQGVIQ